MYGSTSNYNWGEGSYSHNDKGPISQNHGLSSFPSQPSSYMQNYSPYQEYSGNGQTSNWNYNLNDSTYNPEKHGLSEENNPNIPKNYQDQDKNIYPNSQNNQKHQSYYRQHPYMRQPVYQGHPSHHGELNVNTKGYNQAEQQNYEGNSYTQTQNYQVEESIYDGSESKEEPTNPQSQNFDSTYSDSQYHYNQGNYSQEDYYESSHNTNYSNGTNCEEYSSPLKALENKRSSEKIDANYSKNTEKSNSRKKKKLFSDSVEDDNRRPPPVIVDPSLPPEISALFTTNFCKLCDVQLNSRVQAKFHYDGKPHSRKLKSVLDKNDEKTSTEDVSVTSASADDTSDQSSPSKKKKKVKDGDQLYCKICDLSFTSTDHATQHYLGRNHERVLHGFKPLKTGYYNNDTGKWQRMPPDPITPTERLTEPSDGTKEKGRYFCELCCVGTTSKEQMEIHLAGNRHRRVQIANKKKKKDSILASVIKANKCKDGEPKKSKIKDFSIYRTPSGQFYCSECDLTMNSESQFAQHIESKKHKIKRK